MMLLLLAAWAAKYQVPDVGELGQALVYGATVPALFVAFCAVLGQGVEAVRRWSA